LRLFCEEQRGVTAIVFAMTLFVIVMIGGLALDYARAERARLKLLNAADAANLAASKAAADIAASDPDLASEEVAIRAKAIGEKFFEANVNASGYSVRSYALDVASEGGAWTASSTFEVNVPVTLLAVTGKTGFNIDGKSSASVKSANPVLDIAMCIDSTGSMTPTLDAVKANATTFYDNLRAELDARGVPSFAQVRVRLSYFKDYGDIDPTLWDPDPMRSSGFFSLPDQNSDFLSFAAPQMAYGGWDWAEGDIVCLNDAIQSPWMEIGDPIPGTGKTVTAVYPLIVVWTDSPAHKIDFPNSLANPDYPPPSVMPRSYPELLAKWSDSAVIDQSHKQILFFGDPLLTDDYTPDDPSAWLTVREWPGFTVGGTLLEGNTSMVEFIAEGIARTSKDLAITN
jgi:hypothetical protein